MNPERATGPAGGRRRAPGAPARARRVLGVLLAPIALACSAAAWAAPDVLLRASAPEEYLAIGMPLSAMRAFLALPAAARAKSAALPDILAALSAAGHDNAALSLFSEAGAALAGPARARALAAAGKIHWGRKDFVKAAEAFRAASATAGAAPDAALYLARLQASRGNADAALRQLAAAPPGDRRTRIAAGIARLRSRPDAAALRAEANAMPRGASGHAGANAALSRALLEDGDSWGALDAAREGIAGIGTTREGIRRLPAWNGDRSAADGAWKSVTLFFPDDADPGAFYAAGRAFLAAADLADAARAAGNGARAIARRSEWARGVLARARGDVERTIRRAGEIRAFYRARGDKGADIRRRAREAAEALPLAAWGRAEDPDGTALLGRLEAALAGIRTRRDQARAAVDAAERRDAGRAPSVQVRRTLSYARARIDRADEEIRALEGQAAFLRGRIRNRWKALYVRRLSALLDKADGARRTAGDGAARADAAARPMSSARTGLARWEAATARFSARLAADAGAAGALRDRARNAAQAARVEALRVIDEAVARSERSLHFLAARAATELLIADRGSASPLVPGSRAALLAEARVHWEASLASPGDPGGPADEALYALAEIGVEEAGARARGTGGPGAGRPDYAVPAKLFRRIVDEFPGSPYAEQSYYGLALCWQESNAPDNAAAVLAAMLARYPETRHADAIHLRLGEHAFDQGDFRLAEAEYRKVGTNAPPAIRATAHFKLGWSLFLTERFREAADPFLASLLAAPAETGLSGDALGMTARALVEAGAEDQAVELLGRSGAAARGPALLVGIQRILDAQNRYDASVRLADRFGAAYPLAGERIDVELAAADALRKASRANDSVARRGDFHVIFGPGSRWQTAPGRTPADIARADVIAEEGLRSAAFHFHGLAREAAAGSGGPAPRSRADVLALYDAHIALFPASPKAGEIGYQRAWLLFEAGRKAEAGAAFAAEARRPATARGESSWYMAVQCAKDAAAAAEAGPPGTRDHALGEVIRLCDEYERAFPRGDRISYVLLDRARASFKARRYPAAAADAERAASLLAAASGRREALRLSGNARFEAQDYAAAEKSFRALLASAPPADEKADAEKWTGFSMFRRAEGMPRDRAAEAAGIFAAVAREFPALEIATTARFRAGTSAADAGLTGDAIAAFLAVEAGRADAALARDATRWLASLYEKSGDKAAAAERYERLAGSEPAGPEKGKLLLHAAGLLAGLDEPRARRNLVAVAALPDTPPALRVTCLVRAADGARAEGRDGEAQELYEKATAAHLAAPDAAPATAAKAYFARAETRFARYRSLSIAPPLEKTFAEKKGALEGAAALYIEAIRIGDAETVPASLHRLGEGFEDFRGAILASPPPRGLSDREREEYVFLLEEKAAPIEDKAVDAYRRNLRQAVAAGVSSPWVDRSVARLKVLRPALFARKWEYAFPVVPVPDFLGIIVRTGR